MQACDVRDGNDLLLPSLPSSRRFPDAPRLRVHLIPQAETALMLVSKAQGSSNGVILPSSELGAGAAARVLTRLFGATLPPLGELRMARVRANGLFFSSAVRLLWKVGITLQRGGLFFGSTAVKTPSHFGKSRATVGVARSGQTFFWLMGPVDSESTGLLMGPYDRTVFPSAIFLGEA